MKYPPFPPALNASVYVEIRRRSNTYVIFDESIEEETDNGSYVKDVLFLDFGHGRLKIDKLRALWIGSEKFRGFETHSFSWSDNLGNIKKRMEELFLCPPEGAKRIFKRRFVRQIVDWYPNTKWEPHFWILRQWAAHGPDLFYDVKRNRIVSAEFRVGREKFEVHPSTYTERGTWKDSSIAYLAQEAVTTGNTAIISSLT